MPSASLRRVRERRHCHSGTDYLGGVVDLASKRRASWLDFVRAVPTIVEGPRAPGFFTEKARPRARGCSRPQRLESSGRASGIRRWDRWFFLRESRKRTLAAAPAPSVRSDFAGRTFSVRANSRIQTSARSQKFAQEGSSFASSQRPRWSPRPGDSAGRGDVPAATRIQTDPLPVNAS